MNLSFRLCTQGDIPLANRVLVQAYNFTDNREALLHDYWLLQPDGWWLAFVDDTPVGFGGAVDYVLFSSIGMICVLPAFQGRGIGEALTRQILSWCKERGCPTMLLEANQKAVSLYKRLGFVEEELTLFCSVKDFPQENTLPESIALFREEDLPEVVRFDAQYFGADREKIFALYVTKNPERAFVLRDPTGMITGYLVAQPHSLGPWVASTPEDAKKLLLAAFTLSFPRGISNTFPASNQAGRELLQRYGFQEATPSCHMRLGVPVQAMQRSMIYGQGSMAIG